MDWPFEYSGNSCKKKNIADYLTQNKFDMVINLPLRNSGARRSSSFLTHGYRTRRMAIDYSIPLITDIKCAKLFIEVMSCKITTENIRQTLVPRYSSIADCIYDVHLSYVVVKFLVSRGVNFS